MKTPPNTRTNVQLHCTKCDYRAKRSLQEEVACRGAHETGCEPASCPNGHGFLVRDDGGRVNTSEVP